MNEFDQAFARLASLTNYEKQPPDRRYRFDLSGMRALCAALGHPEERLGTVIQIGGSKGKGTVTHLLAGMGVATGRRCAAYTSPHVRDVLERVLWQGRPVAPEAFASSLTRAADRMQEGQTWFEVFTAAALEHFAGLSPDWTVLEVGLGGRLDSTTVVPKQLCAITTIELEHTQVLGEDLPSIAREKAGILRPGVPCVTGATGAALTVITKRARTMGAPLRVSGRDFGLEIRERSPRGIDATLWSLGAPTRRMLLPLRSLGQAWSFSLARELLLSLDPVAEERLLGAGDLSWLLPSLPPGRFQVVDPERPVVVDGAHTNASLRLLAADLRASYPGRRFALVFGVAAGKHWEEGLGQLLPLVDIAFAAPLVGKASEASESVRDHCVSAGVPCELFGSITEALAAARATETSHGIVVTGSLYAAGEALSLLSTSR